MSELATDKHCTALPALKPLRCCSAQGQPPRTHMRHETRTSHKQRGQTRAQAAALQCTTMSNDRRVRGSCPCAPRPASAAICCERASCRLHGQAETGREHLRKSHVCHACTALTKHFLEIARAYGLSAKGLGFGNAGSYRR